MAETWTDEKNFGHSSSGNRQDPEQSHQPAITTGGDEMSRGQHGNSSQHRDRPEVIFWVTFSLALILAAVLVLVVQPSAPRESGVRPNVIGTSPELGASAVSAR